MFSVACIYWFRPISIICIRQICCQRTPFMTLQRLSVSVCLCLAHVIYRQVTLLARRKIHQAPATQSPSDMEHQNFFFRRGSDFSKGLSRFANGSSQLVQSLAARLPVKFWGRSPYHALHTSITHARHNHMCSRRKSLVRFT